MPSWRRFSAASAQRVQVGQVGRGFCRYVCRHLCRRLGARPAAFAYRRIGMPDRQAVVGHGPVGCRQRTHLPVNGCRCVPHDPAVSHRDDAPCPSCHRWIVGDQDQRVAGSGQFVQLLHYLLAARRIQRSGRLVGQNHSPSVDQCPRNRHPLLLAARELVGQVLQTLRQAQSREQGSCAFVPRLLAHPRIAGRHRHIVQCRGRADQVVALEDETEHLAPQRGQRIVVQPRDRLALEQVLTAAGTVQATQDVHQRRLARARCPDDGHVLARLDPKVDAVQDLHLRHPVMPPETLAHLTQLDQHRCCHGCLLSHVPPFMSCLPRTGASGTASPLSHVCHVPPSWLVLCPGILAACSDAWHDHAGVDDDA